MAHAQAPADKGGIVGTWQGTLHAPGGHDLRTVLKVTNDDKGALHATFFSIDQSAQGIPTSSISFDSGTLKYAIEFAGLTYEGKMSADGNSISGASTQGDHTLPLVFERATPETEWAMPAPPPRIPPMAADANPSFEVATIKPTRPDERGTYITVRGTDLVVVNFSLNDLIKFAYDVQEKQIVGGPDWMATDKWDIDAKPDTPGRPNQKQMQTMLRKMLADRFALKFHNDHREMGAYILTVGKDGPKMTKETSDPNGLPGLFFGPIGTLHVRNATVGDFTGLMQSAVLDRPVVDKTGLDGRWNFTLKWTPDESQFAGMGIKVPPPPADATDVPPPLFTAIREQLDLKLEAQKTQVPVLMIDHVDHPSPN
ncbi:MAG TPA: TIGR03435 family protein [Acidobacteriaceae bacterium]|nr:TIGR03435 family protein [Acidobacteriaceae bacterium]